jgi:hypothetical protein
MTLVYDGSYFILVKFPTQKVHSTSSSLLSSNDYDAFCLSLTHLLLNGLVGLLSHFSETEVQGLGRTLRFPYSALLFTNEGTLFGAAGSSLVKSEYISVVTVYTSD